MSNSTSEVRVAFCLQVWFGLVWSEAGRRFNVPGRNGPVTCIAAMTCDPLMALGWHELNAISGWI